MDAGKVIYSLLSASTDLQAIVGQKIFPVVIPEKTGMPAMVYALEGNQPTQIKQAASPIDVLTYSITIFVDDFAEAQAAMDAVRAALDQQSGTIAGAEIDNITFQGEADEPYDFEKQFFVVSHSYEIRMHR